MNTEDIKAMKEQIWNYVVNKKELNKPEYVLDFRFFKAATFCFDSFAHSQSDSLTGVRLQGVPVVKGKSCVMGCTDVFLFLLMCNLLAIQIY